MNLEKLNHWLALAANIGVLLGIIFLAMELRQNSEVLIAQTQADAFNRRVGFAEQIMGNPDLALAISKMENNQELDAKEDVLVRAMALRTLRQLEWTYREDLAGRLEVPIDLQVFIPGFQGNGIFRWPLGEYWSEMKEFLAPDFVEFVEENIVQ